MKSPSDSHSTGGLSRRAFLRNTIGGSLPLAATGSLVAANSTSAADNKNASSELPRKQLGKDGPMVTRISQGGSMNAHSANFLEIAWRHGIRYFDASSRYLNGQCEANIAEFLDRDKARRKELFLVSKDPAESPKELLTKIDQRLKALHTDYLDLYFIHGINTRRGGIAPLEWPKSDEWREVSEKLKKSGKVKMCGFSCHDARLNDFIMAAAEGGFLDAIMVAYDPFHEKGGAFDKALDACHKAGIGLVAMKNFRALGDVPARLPDLDKLGLTAREALLHTVMSDKRITAMCVESTNIVELEENTGAVHSYDPEKGLLAANILRSHRNSMEHRVCPGCESCQAIASAADVALLDIARYVAYYETDGKTTARDMYQRVTSQELDLSRQLAKEARERCRYSVNYPAILERAEKYFA